VKKKYTREKIVKRLFSILLFLSWIGFMAFASLFISSFLPQLPMFQVKEVVIEGNKRIEFNEIKDVIEELSGDLLKLNENEILETLVSRSGGRIKKVYLSKNFSLNGITINLKIIERIPVAKIKLGNSYMLLDREGYLFKPVEGEEKNLPEIKTYDIDLLRKHFYKLYDRIISLNIPLKSIDIKKDKIILLVGTKTVILPPPDLLPVNISARLKMIYNFPDERVDLRYDRFILVR